MKTYNVKLLLNILEILSFNKKIHANSFTPNSLAKIAKVHSNLAAKATIKVKATKLIPILMSNSTTGSLTSYKGSSLFTKNGVSPHSVGSIAKAEKLVTNFINFFNAIDKYQIPTLSAGTRLLKSVVTLLNSRSLGRYKTLFKSQALPLLNNLTSLKSASGLLRTLLPLLKVNIIVFLENAALNKVITKSQSLGYFTASLIDTAKPLKNVDIGLPCFGTDLHKQFVYARLLLSIKK
jgi:hypothetical protein